MLTESVGRHRRSGEVPSDREVYVAASAAPDWHLDVDGESVDRQDAFGWANVFPVDRRR